MDRLRREADPTDAEEVSRLLRRLSLDTAPDFPADPGEVDRAPFYSAAPFSIELAQQGTRLRECSAELVDAINCLADLNAAILDGDRNRTDLGFESFRDRHGISLLVAQKAITLRHSGPARHDRRADHSEVIAPFLSPRRQVVAVAFEDSVDEERDYVRIRRIFRRFVGRQQLDPEDAAIVSDLFDPLRRDETVLSQRLQAYGRWGVLDALACLFRIRRISELEGDARMVASIDAVIPSEVADRWREAFGALDPWRLREVIGVRDQFYERAFFAHLPAWSEFDALFDHRLAMERAVGQRLDGDFPVLRPAAASMATPMSSVADLLAGADVAPVAEKIDTRSCGAFHRTVALVASIEANGLDTPDGDSLCSLLDQTIDVASMLSKDELAKLMPRRRDDALHDFLRTAVMNDFEESKVGNHALRRSLQHLVGSRFRGNIVELLEHVDTENHHVSRHLYTLCGEAFLTELYDLFEQTDEVTAAHAAILEWWGERADDKDARLRARSHRLTLRLRRVRGAIEETRIYVDPLRFIAWIDERLSGELRTIAVQADLILQDTDRSVNLRDGVRLALQPRLKLLSLLDRCYEEFCTNKLYGVTSFIGRRIRHGTLHGHLVLEFRPTVIAAIDEFRSCAPRFSEFLKHWLIRFDAAVLAMAADQIHVKSKDKARGIIVATLDEAQKAFVANRMVESIAKSLSDRPQIALSAALIHEFCWLLFEIDLIRVRSAVEALRRDFVIIVDDHHADRPDVDRRVAERIRSLNSALQQRFEGVQSWFTRPTNQSPSASINLLFEAVLDEVRPHFPDFRPKTNVTGDGDLDLIGHRFHFFYDAMYLLVGNAAKHARRGGVLGMHIATLFEERHVAASVSIRSELDPRTRDADVAGIEEAMAEALGDAVMTNRKSGIRKLREMVEDVDEITALHHRYEDGSVVFTLDMRFDRT